VPIIPFFNRIARAGSGTDDFNPNLPAAVQQLLQLTGSQYATDRAAKLANYLRYYNGTQYDRAYLQATFNETLGVYESMSDEPGASLQVQKQLWQGVRPLSNYIGFVVDKDKELTYKNARPQPVRFDAELEQRLISKWEQGRWSRHMPLSAFYAASMGDTYLRMIPGALGGWVGSRSRLGVYSPETMTVLRDQHMHHRIIAAKIEYLYTEANNRIDPRKDVLGTLNYESLQARNALGLSSSEQIHTYTMIITDEMYCTFRDHTLYSFDDDLGAQWDNTLGFVPVVQVPFNDVNEDMGLPTFYGVIPALDAVNELSSMAGQILKNTADAPLVVYGVSKGTKFEKTLNASGQTVWIIPAVLDFTGHQVQPHMEYVELKAGSLASMLEFVEKVKQDVKAALPEMQLMTTGQRTGSGYEDQVEKQGVVSKLDAARESQFGGTEDILQMALVADDVGDRSLGADEGLRLLEEARDRYDLTIWAESVLPKSRSEESQTESVSLADGVITMRDARLARGWSYTKVLEVEKQEEVEFKQMLDRQRQWLELHAKYGVQAPTMPTSAGNGNMIGSGVGNVRATKPTSGGKPGGNAGITTGNNRTQGQPNTAPNGSGASKQ
jgi:hypothetical protein